MSDLNVKMMSNSISLGSNKPFSDYANKVLNKTAAKEETLVKTAAKEEKEGKSSGQPEAEAKLVNQPKTEEKAKSTGSGAKKEKGEAESSGQLDVEPLHQKGESVKPSAVTCENKKTEASVKEAKKELPDFIKEKIKEKEEKEGKKDGDKDEKKEDKKDDDEKDMKASKSMCASTQTQVIKLGKMNDKTRSMLKKYFSRLYPAAYVEAMLGEQ